MAPLSFSGPRGHCAAVAVPEPGRIVAYNRYLYAYADPLTYSDPTGMYSDQQIMTHFGCETWACVEAHFQNGGSLDGLWGWLEILKIAQDGDAIETKGWAGYGNTVSYTTTQGTFAIGAQGTIGVHGVSGQQDAFSPGRVDLQTWEAMVGDGFARLAAGMNAQGPMDGFYRIPTRGVAMFHERGIDCQHHDCVERTLNAVSTTTSGIALGCAAAALVPCTAAAGLVGRATTTLGAGYEVYQLLTGRSDGWDLGATAATGFVSWTGSPPVSLAADLAQWIWDEARR